MSRRDIELKYSEWENRGILLYCVSQLPSCAFPSTSHACTYGEHDGPAETKHIYYLLDELSQVLPEFYESWQIFEKRQNVASDYQMSPVAPLSVPRVTYHVETPDPPLISGYAGAPIFPRVTRRPRPPSRTDTHLMSEAFGSTRSSEKSSQANHWSSVTSVPRVLVLNGHAISSQIIKWSVRKAFICS